MAATDLRDNYLDTLMGNVRNTDYPSRELMDRIESGIRTEDHAEQYIELLLSKVQNMAPSLQLLDRISRMLRILDASQRSWKDNQGGWDDLPAIAGAKPRSRRVT